jgi:hypothetical protein
MVEIMQEIKLKIFQENYIFKKRKLPDIFSSVPEVISTMNTHFILDRNKTRRSKCIPQVC